MGFKSYTDKEQERIVTLPNAMTAARAVGGIALGVGLALQGVTALEAVSATLIMGATDAEGNVIGMADKYPKLHGWRDKLRIFPSSLGRKADPVADKIASMAVFGGALVGGYVEPGIAGPVLAAELITSGAGMWAESRGVDPQVSTKGKAGLVARGVTFMTGIMASDTSGNAHQVLETAAYGSAGIAIGLGIASAIDLVRQSRSQ